MTEKETKTLEFYIYKNAANPRESGQINYLLTLQSVTVLYAPSTVALLRSKVSVVAKTFMIGRAS